MTDSHNPKHVPSTTRIPGPALASLQRAARLLGLDHQELIAALPEVSWRGRVRRGGFGVVIHAEYRDRPVVVKIPSPGHRLRISRDLITRFAVT